MQLTRVLAFYKKYRHIPGKITTGKHRIIPKVTVGMKRAALNQILLEEKNLGLLDNPYISKEEAKGYMSVLGIPQARFQELKEQTRSKMMPHVRTEDILSHLSVKRAWE